MKPKSFHTQLNTKNLQAQVHPLSLTPYSANLLVLVYPERLLIYHCGTLKAAAVGFIKLAPVFFFASTTLFIAPTYVESFMKSSWEAVPLIILGTVPMLIVSIMTSPFVASVHMRVPAAARINRAVLLRYCENLPQSTPLDFTTVRLIGLPKCTSTTLGQLRALRPRFGRLANIQLVNDDLLARRTLWAWLTTWMREPRNKLYVGGAEGMKRSRAPGVWKLVWEQIQKKPMIK